MEIPDHCLSNETLMILLQETGLLDNSTSSSSSENVTTHQTQAYPNYADPNFNVSLCYDKLDDNETHSFLHYETGLWTNITYP